MRTDNRQAPGGSRRHLGLVLPVLCAALPAIGFASAMGNAPWAKVDLSAYTTLGVLQMKLSTVKSKDGLRLDELKIEVDGKMLRIPAGVDLKVLDPHLNSVAVVTTRSITCLDDECPDPSGLPVYIDLEFGDYAADRNATSECEFSLLRVDVEADGISEITRWDCVEGRQVEHVLYERKDAGER